MAGGDDAPVSTMASNDSFLSGGLRLASYFARPNGVLGPLRGLILCHGFRSARSMPVNPPEPFRN